MRARGRAGLAAQRRGESTEGAFAGACSPPAATLAAVSGVAHHVLLGLAVAALLGAGFRLASMAAPTGIERTIAAVVFAAGLAALQALALGAFGVGTKALPLGIVAGLTWVTAVLVLPAPEVGPGRELVASWRRLGPRTRLAPAILAGVGAAVTVWLLRHPSIGLDSNLYQYLDVARWLHDGHIGGFERLDYGVSYSSYPLTNEVLLAWSAGIARSFAPLTLWMPAMLALAGLALWQGLRSLEVPPVVALLAVAALVTLPLAVRELNEPSNDVPALAWLACAGALCAGARRRPALLAPALLAGGLALGTKTTTLVPLALSLALAVWSVRRRLAPLALPLGLALVGAIAVGGIWFIRGVVLYGSPLWPHLALPWGEPRPHFFTLIDQPFIGRPAATLHGRGDVYAARLAGGLVLILATLLAPLAATRLAGVRLSHGQRRAVLVAAAAAVLALVAWLVAPVTGLPRAQGLTRPGDLAVSGLRYMLPALLAAIAAIGVAARSSRRMTTAAGAVLGGAVGANLGALTSLGPPFTPSLVVLAAGAGFGLALLALALGIERVARGRRLPALSGAIGGAALAAVLGGSLAAGAPGYVERFSRLEQSTALGRPVAAWFLTQPGFAHGHRPIAFATRAPIAALAGDRFNHPLNVIPPFETCPRVLERARAGWVVVSPPRYGYGFLGTDPYTTPGCLARRKPAYDDGAFRVYRLR